MTENLQTIIASYFRWWGEEMATMLTKIGDAELQRKVVNAFMRVIQEDLWAVEGSDVRIDAELDAEVKEPVTLLVGFYYLERLSENTIESCLAKIE